MIQFLSMLKGAAGSAGSSGGSGNSRLGQAIGTKGSQMIKPSEKIGMQYVNMGLTPPEVPNMMNMLSGMNNLTAQGGPRNIQIYDIMRMLQGGQ